jgi:hypothetical protein
MSFVSFNYFHPTRLVWVPVIYNTDRIERVEPDTANPTMTRIWTIGEDFPGTLTDMAWATAAVVLGVTPPKTAPTVPPVATNPVSVAA